MFGKVNSPGFSGIFVCFKSSLEKRDFWFSILVYPL